MTGPLPSLPQIAGSSLPRAVREGDREDRQAYRTALGFERLFAEQLLKSASGERALVDGPQGAIVDDALTDAVMAGGGVGLAARLYPQIRDAIR